jgi:8-oxo-dGTP pyrophosphatase MutT (NUDIX family)
MKIKREFSSGGVVYKKVKIPAFGSGRSTLPIRPCSAPDPSAGKQKLKILFLLGKHSGYHKWVLPKGLIEPGEKDWQTALRETEEEMGVKARLVREKPIYKEKYFYYADLIKVKSPSQRLVGLWPKNSKIDEDTRRVIKYQEAGGGKTKIFKTVTFYLMEYFSGGPLAHGWEMEEAGWFDEENALKIMAFEGEKEALKKAKGFLNEK